MIEDKERAKRLNEVYRYLYANKGVVSQTLFASQIGVQRSALSAAMNGNKLYLTNNLFMKVCAAYPDTFDLDYLLTGEGSLLVEEGGAKVQDTDSGELEALRSRIKILEEQVARQRQIIDHYESFVEHCEIPTETIGKCLAHAWSKNTVTARYISDDRRKVDQAFALVLDKVRG